MRYPGVVKGAPEAGSQRPDYKRRVCVCQCADDGWQCDSASVGVWGSVSFMYYGDTGCNYMRRRDPYGGLIVLLLRCSGGMRGIKSLCAGSGLSPGFGDSGEI